MRNVAILILFVFLAACTPQLSPKASALEKCIHLCGSYNGSLTQSPCLSNEIAPDWVCDVAHNPRQAIDNLQENQCLAFRKGKAHHFVELDENCNLIRLH